MLAGRLERRYDLVLTEAPEASSKQESPPSVAEGSGMAGSTESLEGDLAWLGQAPPGQVTDAGSAISRVLDLLAPVARQHGAILRAESPSQRVAVAIQPMALRQILIAAISVAIHKSPAAVIAVSCLRHRSHSLVIIRGQCSPQRAVSLSSDDEANLDMAARLARASHGSLASSLSEEGIVIRVHLPALPPLPILVVDDNVDALQLFERYAEGTRYAVSTFSSPQSALEQTVALQPAAVVMDVMMPHVDGWEAMGWFRQRPATREVPIIVCTILAQEELAFALGASGFLRKPVTRQAFLAKLDQVILGSGPPSR